jgi:hypothetical protein
MTATSLDEIGARWRLTVHRRDFSPNNYAPARTTGIAEISDARSRRLEFGWNAPAKLTFTVDGRSPSAGYIQELTTEVMAWRWDPADGRDHLMFRGVVYASEDTLSEQAHVVNWSVIDHLGMINRRYLTGTTDLVYTQRDQDDIVADLLTRATVVSSSGGTSFSPGSRLPVALKLVYPDGTTRAAKSGILRDRTYTGGSAIGQLITDLAAVIGATADSTAFDVDIQPAADTDGHDWLRVWYPGRGQARSDLALVYGATVAAATRTVASGDGYANYIRVLGDNGGTEGAPQLIAESWNTDANNVGAVPVGLWMSTDSASDVKIAATLKQKADGDLRALGILVPSYTLTLRPGWYRPGRPALGDTVPLVIQSPPRLDVSTTTRVLGLNFAIGDDGQEDVEVTVGRPPTDLTAIFRKTARTVDALARR